MPIDIQPTAITVDYTELEGSPQERYDRNGFQAVRQLRCAWPDRLTLAEQLRGGSVDINGVQLYRPPAAYPWKPEAVVETVVPSPFSTDTAANNGDTTEAVYSYAQLEVTYRIPDGVTTPKRADQTDPAKALVTESFEPTVEYLTLPGQALYWPDGSQVGDEQTPAIQVLRLTWVYTVHQVKEVPADILSLIGRTNSRAMTSPQFGWTFDEDTLLFAPAPLERELTTEGETAMKLTYKFHFREEGWNLFNKGDGLFRAVYTASSAEARTRYRPYPRADLNRLIEGALT